jgi:hypothetical protein
LRRRGEVNFLDQIKEIADATCCGRDCYACGCAGSTTTTAKATACPREALKFFREGIDFGFERGIRNLRSKFSKLSSNPSHLI